MIAPSLVTSQNYNPTADYPTLVIIKAQTSSKTWASVFSFFFLRERGGWLVYNINIMLQRILKIRVF